MKNDSKKQINNIPLKKINKLKIYKPNENQYNKENKINHLTNDISKKSESENEVSCESIEESEEINYPKSDFKDYFQDLRDKTFDGNLMNKNSQKELNQNEMNYWNQSFFANSISTNGDSHLLNTTSFSSNNKSINNFNYPFSYKIQQKQILEQQKLLNEQRKIIEKQQKLIEKQFKQKEKSEKNETLNLIINNFKILNQQDTRTTIMIKNIPNKFTREMLISIIDYKFKGCYDLLIFPQDANKCKNFGYGFINFIHPFYIPYFYFLFDHNTWSGTNSQKICELSYSKIQGKNQLLKHYPNKIIYVNIEGEKFKNNVNPKLFILPNIYKYMFICLYPNCILVNQNEVFFTFLMI